MSIYWSVRMGPIMWVLQIMEVRLEEHNAGISVKAYTFNRRPVMLKYWEYFAEFDQAIAREKQLKGWTRKKKEALIEENWGRLKELSECKNETGHKYYRGGEE